MNKSEGHGAPLPTNPLNPSTKPAQPPSQLAPPPAALSLKPSGPMIYTVQKGANTVPFALRGASAAASAGSFTPAVAVTLTGASAAASAGSFTPAVAVKSIRAISDLLLQAVIVRGDKTAEGRLLEAVTIPWFVIIALLQKDPSIAFQISPEKWEEMIAVAYHRCGLMK
jgi:hypothetical protein